MSAWASVRGARAAFAFLTRVPVGGYPYDDDDWRWASSHFPLVGAALGVALACVDRALLPLGDAGAAIATLAVSLLLTGAFHEDGLADTSDALGGAYDRERILVILKDSRVGTFGACAVVVSIAGRAALLARLGHDAAWALPLVGAIARVGPVWQMVALPYVTASGAARSREVTRARAPQALVATAWAIAVAVAVTIRGSFSPLRVASVFASSLVVTVISGWRYRRRLGGVTGDFLGATEQLCELAAFATLTWGR